MAAADWPLVARVLVESHAVPRILAAPPVSWLESAVRVPAVGDAEPVLSAAVALAHRNVDVAEGTLEGAIASKSDGTQGSVADRLAVAFAQLGAARARVIRRAG